ncbi:hypothetical protein ACU610_02260 [Geodermatophilus sp. URMC 61]|uniref:hypothetical protein n=1 Tax=Geodermatophilus sp. URMC 61 TaxID=3423411 RepID=UPI00406CD7B0
MVSEQPAPEIHSYPVNRPWREGVITRAKELEELNRWIGRHPERMGSEELSQAVCSHVRVAIGRARDRNPWRAITGSSLQGATTNLDAAEACLLRLAPDSYLRGQMPSFLAHVRRQLPPHDPRRSRLEEISAARRGSHQRLNGNAPAERRGSAEEARGIINSAVRAARRGPQRNLNGNAPTEPHEFSDEERGIIIGAVRAASSRNARELMLAKSFLNTLVFTSLILVLLAVAVAVFGFVTPSTVSLCFAPETAEGVTVVCPTAQSVVGSGDTGAAIDQVMDETAAHWDLFTVEALGLAAAAISAAVALRNIHGTHTPVGIPISLALLKLPLGSLTAVLGLLLMRGGFVPGLTALDSPPQILAWAVLFGYAQQIFTRLVDRQAHTVLEGVTVEVPEETASYDTASAARRSGRGRTGSGVSTADSSG